MIVLTPDLEAQKREQEKKAQFEALVKRANSEDPIAAFKLAHYYYKKQEFIKASIYLREAAIQGHVEAMYELARMYEIGEGVPSSYVATKKWYREALKRGHPTFNEHYFLCGCSCNSRFKHYLHSVHLYKDDLKTFRLTYSNLQYFFILWLCHKYFVQKANIMIQI